MYVEYNSEANLGEISDYPLTYLSSSLKVRDIENNTLNSYAKIISDLQLNDIQLNTSNSWHLVKSLKKKVINNFGII